jgi:hypothetical protein
MIAGGRKTIGFFLAAVMMFSLVALMLMGALPAQAAANEIAYIYDTDVASATSYEALLEANGYEVTQVHMDDVATTDFSTYGLIIVGQDTGFTYTWGDAPSVSAIEGSGKPIIGLYRGGASLFQELGLSINYGNGGVATNQTGINVTDPSHTIFNSPNSIPVPGDGIVALYSSPCTLLNEDSGSLSPDADPLGCVAVYSSGYYPLVQEEQNVLWGFEGSPDTMTQEGEDLFVNVVHYLFLLSALDAEFTADPTTGTAPLTVQFTDQSTGDITSWAWDFDNDGKVDSNEQNPSHTYNTTGSYTVSLKVTDPWGYSLEVKGDYITVSSGGLSGGAIAGIVIGACAAAGLIAYFVIRSRRAAGKGA